MYKKTYSKTKWPELRNKYTQNINTKTEKYTSISWFTCRKYRHEFAHDYTQLHYTYRTVLIMFSVNLCTSINLKKLFHYYYIYLVTLHGSLEKNESPERISWFTLSITTNTIHNYISVQ